GTCRRFDLLAGRVGRTTNRLRSLTGKTSRADQVLPEPGAVGSPPGQGAPARRPKPDKPTDTTAEILEQLEALMNGPADLHRRMDRLESLLGGGDKSYPRRRRA